MIYTHGVAGSGSDILAPHATRGETRGETRGKTQHMYMYMCGACTCAHQQT